MSYFRVPFRVEISQNSVKFQLHKKPFVETRKTHNTYVHHSQINPNEVLNEVLNEVPKKVTNITNISGEIKKITQGYWTLVNANYTEYKVFVPYGLSLDDTINTFYPEIIKAWAIEDEEAAIDEAWDNYDRYCNEWD